MPSGDCACCYGLPIGNLNNMQMSPDTRYLTRSQTLSERNKVYGYNKFQIAVTGALCVILFGEDSKAGS